MDHRRDGLDRRRVDFAALLCECGVYGMIMVSDPLLAS